MLSPSRCSEQIEDNDPHEAFGSDQARFTSASNPGQQVELFCAAGSTRLPGLTSRAYRHSHLGQGVGQFYVQLTLAPHEAHAPPRSPPPINASATNLILFNVTAKVACVTFAQ